MLFYRLSRSVVPVLATVAGMSVLGGCISSKRMTDISPLGENGESKMSENRVNAWPLYYSAGAGCSVLWPFFDFDDKGWAFRPFYVRDGEEHSVIWPLSGWDPKGGWALNAYWDKSSYGLFPLFHKSGSFSYIPNYVFPLWWTDGWSDWGLFPIGGVGTGKGDWRFLNFYYRNTNEYYHQGSSGAYSHWNFWPILFRKSYTEKGESEPYQIDWRLLYGLLGGYSEDKEQHVSWLVPLFFAREENQSRVSINASTSTPAGNDYFTWVFPTFFRSNDGEEFINTLLPFYYYTGSGNDYAFITPLGWHSEQGDSETTAVLPLYYYNTRGSNDYVFATALGGWGKFSDGGHLHYALGPLYIDYASPSGDSEFTSVLWPLYMHSRDGKKEWSYLFPFGHRWTDGEETRRSFLFGLGATRSRDEKTSWALWPLYGSNNDFYSADFRYSFTLAGSAQDSEGKRSSNWLFPLYHYKSREENSSDYEFYALCYLFGIENSYRNYNTARRFENYLFPLYFYDSWTHCDSNGIPTADAPYDSEFYIPLVYGFDTENRLGAKEKSWNHWALAYLFNFRESNYAPIPMMREVPAQSLEKSSCYRYINTFWETRDFRIWKEGALSPREQAIVRNAENYCLNGYSRSYTNSLAFPNGRTWEKSHGSIDLDKEIFAEGEEENLDWDGRYAHRETFFQRELTKILRAKGIEITDNADKDAMTRAVQKLVAENTEIFTEKEFQVWPFYESQEASDGNFEKEFLWGVWYSRGNEEESVTSCLKYLYRRETTQAGTKLDVFPFISVDTGKRGSFSFLGKFFRIVNDDEKGWSGNFLFIPWGDSPTESGNLH